MRGREGDQEEYAEKTGWSQSGTLVTGGNPGVLPSTGKNQVPPTALIPLQCNFQRPTPYTAQFFTSGNPQSNNPIVTIATLVWSVAGNNITRQLTVGDGVSISGTAQSLVVKAIDATTGDFSGETTLNAVPYNVSILVTPGVRASTTLPPTLSPSSHDLYELLQGISTTGDYTLVVPQGVGVTSVQISVINADGTVAPGTAIVEHLAYTYTIKKYDVAQVQGLWIPIFPGTTGLGLHNENTSGTSSYVYNVVYGIDG